MSTFLLLGGAFYCYHTGKIFYEIVYPPQGVYDQASLPGYVKTPFRDGDELTLEVFVSTSGNPLSAYAGAPAWQTTLSYGMEAAAVTTVVNITLPRPPNLVPGSAAAPFPLYLWARFFPSDLPRAALRRYGQSPKVAWQFQPYPLVEVLPPNLERSLLSERDLEEEPLLASDKALHIKPRGLIRLVHEAAQYHPAALPPYGPRQVREETLVPVATVDEMWLTREDYVLMDNRYIANHTFNATHILVPLSLEYQPISAGVYRLHTMIRASIARQMELLGGSEKEMEEVRLMFVENSPIVLLASVVVAVFHLIFEFLSIKNDVAFWRAQKSLVGISLRSLMLQCVSKLIVLAYLRDQNANILVVVGVFLDWLVSSWKLFTAVSVRRTGSFPFVALQFPGSDGGQTDDHDAYALRQLSKVLVPLMLGYLGYSLVYEKHRSWWSFLLHWLASCVYGFGFILMTPQLFLNYKLKSVAHLPWRAMVYRFINTFIDDLFAFIIKMPTMHRVSVLRDDVVFFVYLYQRWIYPIDHRRVCDMDDSTDDSKAQRTTAATTAAKDKAE